MVTREVDATSGTAVRHDWQREEVRLIHDAPLLELVFEAARVHRQFHDSRALQVCRLISVKTGGCPEDCAYCAQAARYDTGVEAQPLLDPETVLGIARAAKANGISRLCMGAAWREVRDHGQFERILELVRAVTALGLEVCCTLGMLTEAQARRLEAAGLYAYNHNLDTSAEYYPMIITTRRYADRLETLQRIRQTKVTVCCGGIIGLGESREDRLALLQTLASLEPHPESIPINLLAKVQGTPLANEGDVPFDEVIRVIATARILMPTSVVRLSAGRGRLSLPEQALCFLAGANSIFSSDAEIMLTPAAPSPGYAADQAMMALFGLRPRAPFAETAAVPREPQRGSFPGGVAASPWALGVPGTPARA